MNQRTEGHRLLRAVKKDRGLRQSEIAREVRRTEPTVYGWLQGEAIPDTMSAIALQKKFGIPVLAWGEKAKR